MNILFGRKKVDPAVHQNRSIQQDFAQTVLDLEVDLNFNCTLEKIKTLMELYTKAIEFYESTKNPKYIHYQERMQTLLIRKDVQKVLNSEIKIKGKKGFKEENKINNIINLPVERTCEKILQNYNSEAGCLSKKITENLKNQAESLDSRLEQRKNARKTKKLRKNSEICESEKSAGQSKLPPVEEFELEVEQIMEEFVEAKASVKKEIENKYNEYFIEIGNMQGEIMKSLNKELEKNMKNEIDGKVKELEEKRTLDIQIARKKLVNC